MGEKIKMSKIKISAFVLSICGALIVSGCGIQTKPDNQGGVYKSTDAGLTFEQKVKINETSSLANSTILSMTVDPQNSEILYVGTPAGLYRSQDGAENWQKLQNDLKSVRDIVINPKDSKIMYVPAVLKGTGKIMKTIDGGENWQEIFTQRTPEGSIFSVAIDYQEPNTLYAGDSSGSIFKTQDGGETWQSLLWLKSAIKEIRLDNVNHEKVYFIPAKAKVQRTEDGGANFIELPFKGTYNVLPHPYREDVLFISDKKGLQFSEDGGMTSKQINTLVRPKQLATRGIAVDPKDERKIYFVSGKAVYRSMDGGVTWNGVQFSIPRIITFMLIDPENTDTIYLGSRQVEQKSRFQIFPF